MKEFLNIYKKKLHTIEGVALKLQRIFVNLTIHCNVYCDLFDYRFEVNRYLIEKL